MAKRILYKSHCTPQEQVSSGGRFYLDSDCGRKLAGSYLYELDNLTVSGTVKVSTLIVGAWDFVAIKAISISIGGTVRFSLDNNSNRPISILEGECFASKIRSDAQPYIYITGTCTVEYMLGT